MSSSARIRSESRFVPEAALFKTAGWAAISISLVYVLLPLLRAVIIALLDQAEETFTAPAAVPDHLWEGIYGSVIFAALGVAIITMVLAVEKLMQLHCSRGGLWHQATTVCGIFAGLGALLSGFTARSMFGPASASLTETGADTGAQIAALQSVNVTAGAFLLLLTLGLSGWLLGVGVVAYGKPELGFLGKSGALGCMVVAGVVFVAQLGAMFFAVQFLFVPLFLVLGLAWLRSFRGLSRAGTPVE